MVTQERLKELLHCDPETGVFTWLKDRNQNVKAGDVAGGNSNGYVRINISGKKYLAHRLFWFYLYGVWPSEIDHINHNRSDNRLCNLRLVSRQENQRNRSINKNNTSGFPGVGWRKEVGKWQATITVSYEVKNLGHFDNISDAVEARRVANIRYGYHDNHGKSLN